VHRKSNTQVSVFILDKEDPAIKSMNKTQKEALLEAFRREVSILKQFSAAKPAPNPNILRLFQVTTVKSQPHIKLLKGCL